MSFRRVLLLLLLLALAGCATGTTPGPGRWGGESYPTSWDDPFYYEKHAQ